MKVRKVHGDDGKTIGFKVERTPEEQKAFDAKKVEADKKREEEGERAAAEHARKVREAAEARKPIERAVQGCAKAKTPLEFLEAAPRLARVLDRVSDLELRGLKPMYDRTTEESAFMRPEQQRALEEIGDRMRNMVRGDAQMMPVRDMRRMLAAEDDLRGASRGPVELPPVPPRADVQPPAPVVPPAPSKPRTFGQEIDELTRNIGRFWESLWKK